MMLRLFIFLALLMSSLLMGQQTFTVGFDVTNQEAHNNFQQTADGGYILCVDALPSQDTGNPQLRRLYLIKLYSTGTVQWIRTFPKSDYANKGDDANAVQQTADGGYIIATSFAHHDSVVNANRRYAYLIKTSSTGVVQWSALYPGLGISVAYCVQQTEDHGYVVGGETRDTTLPAYIRAFLFRTDSVGNLQWGKALTTGSGIHSFHGVCETATGDFAVSGSAGNHGLIVKTDSAGTVIWSQQCNGAGRQNAIQEVPGGGFLIVGADYGQGYAPLYRLTGSGVSLWNKGYTQGAGGMFGCTFVTTSDGYTFSSRRSAFSCARLTHIDTSGNSLWSREYKDANGWTDPALWRTTDGGYAFSARHDGTSAQDWTVIVVKTDSMGLALCNDSAVNDSSFTIPPPAAVVLQEFNAVLTLPIITTSTPVMLVEVPFCTLLSTEEQHVQHDMCTVYPNPASGSITIQTAFDSYSGMRWRLCDVSGRMVFEDELRSTRQEVDLSMCSPGVYVLLIEQNGAFVTQKRVIRN